VAALAGGALPPLRTLWDPDPGAAQDGIRGFLYNYLHWIILLCVVAQVIDTWITLGGVAKKEEEQRMLEAVDLEELAERRAPAGRSQDSTTVVPDDDIQTG